MEISNSNEKLLLGHRIADSLIHTLKKLAEAYDVRTELQNTLPPEDRLSPSWVVGPWGLVH